MTDTLTPNTIEHTPPIETNAAAKPTLTPGLDKADRSESSPLAPEAPRTPPPGTSTIASALMVIARAITRYFTSSIRDARSCDKMSKAVMFGKTPLEGADVRGYVIHYPRGRKIRGQSDRVYFDDYSYWGDASLAKPWTPEESEGEGPQ